MQTLADLEKFYANSEVVKKIMAQIEQDSLQIQDMYKVSTDNKNTNFNITLSPSPIPSPRQLKEQRLRELLREFEEILDMSDEEWEAYEQE